MDIFDAYMVFFARLPRDGEDNVVMLTEPDSFLEEEFNILVEALRDD